MKKMIQVLTGFTIIAGMTGCATPYLHDRVADAKDIFTATIGTGGGAKARVGPLQLGILVNHDQAGIRSGEFFHSPQASLDQEYFVLMPLLLFGQTISTGQDEFKPGGMATAREKDVHTYNILPCLSLPDEIEGRNPAFFTEIEIVAGLGGTVRLGFNPGELLDFLFGWTTLDIYGDDVEVRKMKGKSNQEIHGMAYRRP